MHKARVHPKATLACVGSFRSESLRQTNLVNTSVHLQKELQAARSSLEIKGIPKLASCRTIYAYPQHKNMICRNDSSKPQNPRFCDVNY